MNLIAIADILVAANLGIKGKNLFVNMMPPEVTQAVLLKGRLTGVKINHELPGYYQTKFNVVIRGTDYSIAAHGGFVDSVVDALTFNSIIVGDMYVNYSRPKYLPQVFPLSTGNILEWNTEFDLCYTDN